MTGATPTTTATSTAAGTAIDEAWIEERLAGLTLDEKAAMAAGADAWTTVPVERLGIPALKVTDGPNGARGDVMTGATAACFPVGTAMGATWNPDLLYEVGTALAAETRTKGAQILLGPTVNIHRTPLGGRNFECYSEDPLLTARLAEQFIGGLQDAGVGACIKHYVGNESEYERMTISSAIPERALREIYLLPFEHAVAAVGPWSVMGAYNRVDHVYACAHDRLLNEILKGEWGWDGLLISDWGAVHDTVTSANGGCDLEMPGPPKHFGSRLAEAVTRGDVDVEVVDDKVRRLLRTLLRARLVDEPRSFEETAVDRPEDRALIRRVAAESMVLLKNDAVGDGPVLPITGGATTIALVGPNAESATIMGGGSSIVLAHHQVHPLAALRDRVGTDRVVHAAGGTIDRYVAKPEPRWFAPAEEGGTRGLTITYVDTDDLAHVADGVPTEGVFGSRVVSGITRVWWLPPDDAPATKRWGARWTGTLVPDASGAWTFGMAGIGRTRVLLDGEVVLDNWTDPEPGELFFGRGTTERRAVVELEAGRSYAFQADYQFPAREERGAVRFGIAPPVPVDPVAEAAVLAATADVAVVVVGTNGDWETEGSDRPAMRLPGRQDELIAAVAAANPRTVVVLNTGSPVEMPWIDRVPAVVQAWFGGQEFGDALTDVLLGDADPGGRLPTTFPVRYEDNPTIFNYPGEHGEVRYGENVFVGYRAYNTFGPAPLFPFGHGLSYASITMGAPEVTVDPDDPTAVTATVPVTNEGGRAGSTVVQLYVHPHRTRLARPDAELKAFAKVHLEPGRSTTVRLVLNQRSFAAYDPDEAGWVADAGAYELRIGTSSTAIEHVVAVDLPTTVTVPATDGAMGGRR